MPMVAVVDGYFRVLKIAIVACLVVMVVLVFGNVVLRYGFDSGIPASEEVARWLFVWMTFLGAVIALRERRHLGVDSLVKRLPPLGKKLCLVAAQLLMLVATWLMIQGSYVQAALNLDVKAAGTGWPVAIFYASGLVFGVTAAFILLHDLYRVLAGKVSERDLVQVQESEDQAEFESLQRELSRAKTERSDRGSAP
jgi:TRAP-type C4-dicarboxylate transport system permease small subunit